MLLGDPVVVAGGIATFGRADAAFDANGNLYVAWADPPAPVRGRILDASGALVGPAVDVSTGPIWGARVRTARRQDGTFVNLWYGEGLRANVVSLCTPGTTVCGDGALDGLCELCDDGGANSDTAPNACRTDCRPARCGDGAIDAGETCDDGNRMSCDGCSKGCLLEVGIGCGDGIPAPLCGEPCDDQNAFEGDGCAPGCVLERVPGGGSPLTDCFAAWSVNNPTNDPRYDEPGAISDRQVCVDDDPQCDFDGGVPGSCTFHVQVCVNNTDQAGCTPGTRLASWELKKPNAAQATTKPALAAIRDALLGTVPASVVGTAGRNVCSGVAEVPVARRAGKTGKATLTSRAALYGGATDTDKLRLECRPAP